MATYTFEDRATTGPDNLGIRLLKAPETGRASVDPAVLHEMLLWEEFGGDLSVDVYTDWVQVELHHEQIAGHRLTTLLRRLPVLDARSSDHESASAFPCREFAGIVETTEWGVLNVGVYLDSASEEEQSWSRRDKALEVLRDRVQQFPPPVSLPAALDQTT